MIPLSATKKLRDDGPDRLVLATSPRRRIMSLLLFFVLVTAMIVGVDPATDFTGKDLAGTVFFLCLALLTLLSAAYSWKMILDRSSSRLTIRRDLFMLTVWQKRYRYSEIEEIIFRKIDLLKGTDSSGEDDSSKSASDNRIQPERSRIDAHGFLTVRRRQLTSLSITFKDKELQLDSSTDAAALQTCGMRLADFLEVPFTRKE